MNLKRMLLAAAIVFLTFPALPLHAQSGCVDSPEDPTIVLALVGGAGAIALSFWRNRRR